MHFKKFLIRYSTKASCRETLLVSSCNRKDLRVHRRLRLSPLLEETFYRRSHVNHIKNYCLTVNLLICYICLAISACNVCYTSMCVRSAAPKRGATLELAESGRNHHWIVIIIISFVEIDTHKSTSNIIIPCAYLCFSFGTLFVVTFYHSLFSY